MEGQYCYQYPRPAVTTDCVIFGFDGEVLKVLLVERGGEPYKGCWAFPGGFLNMDETTDECAVRELEEETGLKDVFVEQLQAFSDVDRDPRGRTITVAYYALVNPVGMTWPDMTMRQMLDGSLCQICLLWLLIMNTCCRWHYSVWH